MLLSFWEDPALLVGIPFVVLGALGLLVALMALMAPSPASAGPAGSTTRRGVIERHGTHPSPLEYIQIGVALAVLTAIEVTLFYIDPPRSAFIPMILALSAGKFTLVVLWFMHLKFDSRIFTTAFAGGTALAAAVFVVVLATLGGNLF